MPRLALVTTLTTAVYPGYGTIRMVLSAFWGEEGLGVTRASDPEFFGGLKALVLL